MNDLPFLHACTYLGRRKIRFTTCAMHKIDMHTHLLPERLPNFADKFGYGDFIHLDHHKKGFARMMKGQTFFREIASNCWDPQVRIGEYLHYRTPVRWSAPSRSCFPTGPNPPTALICPAT